VEYREMLKKCSSQEPIGQFQPNLIGNMLADGDLFNKGAGPYWGPIRAKIKKSFINIKKSSSHEPLTGMHCYLV